MRSPLHQPSHLSGPSVLLGLAFALALAPAGARAGELLSHEMSVRLEPETHGLFVRDTIRLPAPPKGGVVEFLLNADFRVTASEPPLVEVALGESLESFGLPGEVPAELALRRYLATTTGTTLTLAYEGLVDYGLSDQKEEYTRGFRSTRGIVGPEGVFLSGGSSWYPLLGPELIEFRMRVEKPADWHVISQGVGSSGGDQGEDAHWDSEGAMDDITLVGGPLERFEDQAGAVRAMVFLHERDAALAGRYLEATARYLELYRGLIGPHAYSKFALVENFWETGYGMPSFTLLGPKVLRFPFIITSSYPHEILHDWWGNSVFVDYESGNWCEGLTAYLADHLLKEQIGQGSEYRRSTLQKYRDYVKEGRDFPLVEFRSRHDAATEAVGYGKTLMGFHALRLQLGDEDFRRLLATFYREKRGKRASFADIRDIAERVSGIELDGFFEEWTKRTGAPSLVLSGTRLRKSGAGFILSGRLEQTQQAAPFTLEVPLVIQTLEGAERRLLRMDARRTRLSFELSEEPIALHVDPLFDTFRLLDPRETPPSIGQIFGEPSIVAVLPSEATEEERAGYLALAEGWRSGNHEVEIVLDTEPDAFSAGRAGWILGRTNLLARRYFEDAARAVDEKGAIPFAGESLSLAGHSTVSIARHPGDSEKAIGWITADPPAALPGLSRKLPHYGKYSYLGFEGDEPTNVVKGQWATTDSPLSVDLRSTGLRGQAGASPLPTLTLAEVPALAELPPAFSSARLQAHVDFLAAPEREGRGLGSAGLEEATAWLAQRFAELGLQPGGDEGGYLQRFELARGPQGRPVEAFNVIGYLPGTKAEFASQSVVVSAHLDHLGRGWPDVHAGDEGLVHPGADDNASGVAVLIEVARAMASGGAPDRSLVFAAFSAEEAGRLGSKHWVEHPGPFVLGGVRAAINLDSVGRLGAGKIQVIATETATEWPQLFRGVGFVTGIDFESVATALASSDHASFLEKGIPAVQLFTGAHADHHRPSDSAAKVDAAGMVKVASFLKESLSYLASRPEPLTATIRTEANAASASAPGASGQAGPRRVSFGTIPNFGFEGPGVKLDGVSEGSPAEAAGLRAGDVLLALDGAPIESLRSFSELLKALVPGQSVVTRFARGAEERETTVTVVER